MRRAALIFFILGGTIFSKPSFMGGVTYTFNGDFGVTLKVLSSDKDKGVVFGVGGTYYPTRNKNQFGLDADIGYQQDNMAIMGGWDFLQKSANISAGYSTSISSDDDSNFEEPPSCSGN